MPEKFPRSGHTLLPHNVISLDFLIFKFSARPTFPFVFCELVEVQVLQWPCVFYRQNLLQICMDYCFFLYVLFLLSGLFWHFADFLWKLRLNQRFLAKLSRKGRFELALLVEKLNARFEKLVLYLFHGQFRCQFGFAAFKHRREASFGCIIISLHL